MELEKLATAAVTASLSKTDRLSSFISSGDKEPCWDGNIYIHENKRRTKKNIKKVATQIKGKAVSSRIVKDTVKYPISYDDLYAYMMNGGTMFFVVYLDKYTGEEIQMYYAELLPVKIKELLKNKQQSYSVLFRRFPLENNQKMELLLNFHSNAQRQASFAGQDIPTIDELSEQRVLESISFHYTSLLQGKTELSYPKMIDGKSLTLYANIKGSTAPIPVQYFDRIDHVTMSTEVESPVSVNGQIYFDRYQTIYNSTTVTLQIGSCVRIISPIVEEAKKTVSANFKVKIQGTLKQRIDGIKLINAMIAHRTITIGSLQLPIKFAKEDIDALVAKDLSEAIVGYEKLQKVLSSMNVTKDLDLDKCSDEDYDKLNILIGAIGDNLPVKNAPLDAQHIYAMKVSNLCLAVIYLPREKGGFVLCDYFGKHISSSWKDPNAGENQAPINVSQFCVLRADDFLRFDNLNLKNVADDIMGISVNEVVSEFTNATLLELLKAYDISNSVEILKTAQKIAEWLVKNQLYLSNEIVTINQLQTILRERALTFEEKTKLNNIANSTKDSFLKLGAFVLLDERGEAKLIFESLQPEEQKRFASFPIFRFYKP